MRALSLSFSTTDLNVAYNATIKKNAFLDVVEGGADNRGPSVGATYRSYAKGLQIYNASGTNIEYALISVPEKINSEGLTEEQIFDAFRTANSADYGWVIIPNNSLHTLVRVPRLYKISLRSVTGAAAAAAVRVDLYPMYGRVEQ